MGFRYCLSTPPARASSDARTGLRRYNANIGTLEFRDVQVPLDRLMGTENRGFAGLARQFNVERLSGIAAADGMSRSAVGRSDPLGKKGEGSGSAGRAPALRHKLVDLVRGIQVA